MRKDQTEAIAGRVQGILRAAGYKATCEFTCESFVQNRPGALGYSFRFGYTSPSGKSLTHGITLLGWQDADSAAERLASTFLAILRKRASLEPLTAS